MLLKYSVSNYKSIGDTLQFSMVPTKDDEGQQFYEKIKIKEGELRVLHRGLFFGANASGKTNFVESIGFATNFIVEGQKSGRAININQFKGQDKKGNISTFQFTFLINENVYEYGFSVDIDKVHEEWLMVLKDNEMSSIYERKTGVHNTTEIKVYGTDAFSTNEIKLIEVLKSSIKTQQRNQLFISKMGENGVDLAEQIINWFKRIVIIMPQSEFNGLEMKVANDKTFAKYLSKMLFDLDTGVSQVISTSKEFPLRKLLEKMYVSQKIIDDIYDKKSGVVEINGKMFVFTDKSGEPFLYEFKLKHSLKGKIYPFDKDEESDGTKRLLDLLPAIFQLEKDNGLYIIDEIDRSFHTLISKEFIKRFLIKSQNTKNQLLATAHDVNLIDLSEVSPQEIWFFDKNNEGVSKIKPLSNFEIEKGYSADLAYLAGRFGGIPTLRGHLYE